ncbi:MAG: hypothetical protein JXR49_08215 [Acidobacteria bacterium]|nr:hypothetical protein [Acidobacteriota bacterium]
MLSRLVVAAALLFGTGIFAYAREEIRLREGIAPGSGKWAHTEAVTSSAGGTAMIRDVVDPSMTAYLPDPLT